jgi:hypothetical protein
MLILVGRGWTNSYAGGGRTADAHEGKSLLHPHPTRVGTHHPQSMKMDFYPLNFLKQDKSPTEVVLKNHSKS